ncbi:MAG: diguanylate cyclase [Chloroflexi bacterium]|nr:diguanylate cyclase [Chloroflexota bacterium]
MGVAEGGAIEECSVTVGLLVVALVAVLAVDVVLFVALVGPPLRRWLAADPGAGDTRRGPIEPLDFDTVGAMDPRLGPDAAMPRGYDRIVRIASWSFILAAAIIVVGTGLWSETQTAVLVVLAIAGVFVLVAHDVLPSGAFGHGAYLVEGTVAIVFVTLVVLLTGGASSPFFFGYALVVAGAALVVRPRVTFALALAAAAGYLAVLAVDAARGGLDAAEVAIVAVNFTALGILAYVATVVAGEQRRTRDAAIRLSTMDALTGLSNRAFFMAALEREIERSRRYSRGFCLLMADLDDLKLLNDSYGHRLGDRALVGVANVIHEGIRRIDTAARLGGDEFLVLLPETDPSGAQVVAEKIRLGAAGIALREGEERVSVAVSIGLVSWPDDGRTVDELMHAVDAAMYRSKRRAKNRVVGIDGRPPGGGPVNDDPIPIVPATLAVGTRSR